MNSRRQGSLVAGHRLGQLESPVVGHIPLSTFGDACRIHRPDGTMQNRHFAELTQSLCETQNVYPEGLCGGHRAPGFAAIERPVLRMLRCVVRVRFVQSPASRELRLRVCAV